MTTMSKDKHNHYMKLALSFAKLSPPKPTNFRVGAILVDSSTDAVLATGYTLELSGNTHAEQCCFMKISSGRDGESIEELLPPQTVLYTTMEPCSYRLSGNLPCVDQILQTHIKTVYVGVYEPSKFVDQNNGRQRLEAAGIEFVHIPGFEDEILKTATEGHVNV